MTKNRCGRVIPKSFIYLAVIELNRDKNNQILMGKILCQIFFLVSFSFILTSCIQIIDRNTDLKYIMTENDVLYFKGKPFWGRCSVYYESGKINEVKY